MREPIISFQRVSKSYPIYHRIGGIKNLLFNFPHNLRAFKQERFEALRDISFEVYRGERFGIIGYNGAGKSTTLGLIAGVIQPTQGKVSVRGRISPLLALGAGFHPELSGRENIELNGILMGLTRRQVRAKMEEIIDFAEMREFIDNPIRIYSTGMTARLGFSVVAHLDPEILLIDEVLSVGDIRFRQKCKDKLLSFHRDVTIVLVTHSVNQLLQLCDRAMWIENHVVKMIGDAKEVAEAYQQQTREQTRGNLSLNHNQGLPLKAAAGSPAAPIELQAKAE
ncbi:MAG TPA: ABC transporter ATP-binding protein [Synechococcales cyanobacterium M55_K2018_004]|nr:ABC transporter ATP-binding protein [Synechococcales cyanobacterium M55_K2018_004]